MCRPVVGGAGRGEEPGKIARRPAHPGGGAGGWASLRASRPAWAWGCETRASEKGRSGRAGAGEAGSAELKEGAALCYPLCPSPEQSSPRLPARPDTRRRLLGSRRERECRAGDKAEAPKGGEQGPLETSIDPQEDVPCPSCSSSSDSETLGPRLPRPCKTPGRARAGDSGISRKHGPIC
ncbi:unnamed protein product [Pipistrellus nathusii]|uniref:Uncharacterized protein n=1 Tax=Pipistrellus nathusii TaxID=59473 RepID=A0ABP0A909_PIPNA